MADGNDIVIKGSSVDLEFDTDVYKPEKGNKKKFYNSAKKILSVEIQDEDGNVVPQVPANGKCTVTIRCR